MYSVDQADPIIQPHALHWVLCEESYSLEKRQTIDEWELLEYTTDYCTYTKNEFCIVAFKGTSNASDIIQDLEITKFNIPDRALTLTPYVQKLLEDYRVQLTGHSLGGSNS